ncbi:hypothetical protein [Okeania sp. SIO2C2]|nr:hypothetical protein [Okeania sp. SIO2C2]
MKILKFFRSGERYAIRIIDVVALGDDSPEETLRERFDTRM